MSRRANFLGRLCASALITAAVGASAWAGTPKKSARTNRYLEIPPVALVLQSPAYHHANLTNDEAFAELDRRGVPYERTRAVLGVRAPIRLKGPVRGVTIRSALPDEERTQTPFEILDARLALALDDLCSILEHHDVVEAVHFTMYRPAGDLREDPNEPQTRHPGGMAIDLGALRKHDGQWLVVGTHWPASIGARTCSRGARKLRSLKGRELQSIVCEAADQRVFHYMLTPHFNRAHRDHIHLEIKPEVKWFLVN